MIRRRRAAVLLLALLAVAALSSSVTAQQETTAILLVDDDWDFQFTHPGSLGGRPFYASALEALGLNYEVWDTQTQGQPTAAALAGRDAVLWFTGYAYRDFELDPGVFTAQNEARVAAYLDAGGRFLLSSQEYYFFADAVTPFMQSYLGVQDISDVWVYTTTVGVPGNPVGDGIGPLALVRPDDYGVYWPGDGFEGPYVDEVYPRPEAGAPFQYNTAPFPPAATNFEAAAFRSVFLGWAFEWIDTVNQRAQVLGSILGWMGLSWPVPEAPILSPIDNPDGNGSYEVDWDDRTGATLYTLEEASDPSFTAPAVRYRGPESIFPIALQPQGTWYYRARASSPGGDSAWSNVEQVDVTVAPPPSPILAPIENGDGDGTYWVAWGAVPTALTYTLEEDDSSNFSSPAVRYQGPDTEFLVEGQAPGLWLYRVRAAGPGGSSPWSNVEPAGVLPAAPLLYPILDGGDGSYEVDWDEVAGASSYTLEEDDNPDFTSPAIRYSGPGSQYSIRFQPGGAWYYRVRANNPAGAGPWSDWQLVHVIPAAPEMRPIDNPDGNGAYTVQWEDVPGVLTYTLQEDDSPAFDSPTVRYADRSPSFVVTGQGRGEWYYRVRASNAGGGSPWSNTEMVKVSLADPVYLPLVLRP